MWKTKMNVGPMFTVQANQAVLFSANGFALTPLSNDKYSLSFVSQPFLNLPDTIGAKVFR